jgi:hypothetical protein
VRLTLAYCLNKHSETGEDETTRPEERFFVSEPTVTTPLTVPSESMTGTYNKYN